ncbi:MAG: hypothetical protein CMH15_17720 [Mesonia sp.]|nr:hypothetical protein [Mesonia sp.]
MPPWRSLTDRAARTPPGRASFCKRDRRDPSDPDRRATHDAEPLRRAAATTEVLEALGGQHAGRLSRAYRPGAGHAALHPGHANGGLAVHRGAAADRIECRADPAIPEQEVGALAGCALKPERAGRYDFIYVKCRNDPAGNQDKVLSAK